MAENKDYRLYLESKFDILGKLLISQNEVAKSQFENVHDKLDVIAEQVTKTNNRVTKLEEQRDNYLRTRVSTDMLCKYHDEVATINQEIDKLKDSLVEYNFFKKYPKLTIAAVLLLTVSMFISTYGAFRTIYGVKELRKIELVQSQK